MRRMGWCAVLALGLFGAAEGRGQVGVYAAFSAAKETVSSTGWIEGATFGAYYDAVHLPVLNLGVDARAVLLGGSGASQAKSGMVGPRLVAHLPVVPLRPYVEGLVGAGKVKFGQGPTLSDSTHAAYGGAAGLDFTFFPRLDWRVVEVGYTAFSGAHGQTTVSTGLVFRLPLP